MFYEVMTVYKLNPEPHFGCLCEHGAWVVCVLTEPPEEEEEEAPRTKIVVGNLPRSVDEEYLEMLFENKKKKGGGTVASVQLDSDLAQAIIEFEEPEGG